LIVEAVGRQTTFNKEAAFTSREKTKAVVVESVDEYIDVEEEEENYKFSSGVEVIKKK
jgi:hypothetical protein